MGGFHAKGWWPKSSCPPSKVCLPWVSKRGIWDVPGILPGCPGPLGVFKKVRAKKVRAHFSFPKKKKNKHLPKGPSRTKNTTDSKFTIRSKFATAIVKHYGGHFETTIFKGKLSSKSLQIVKNYGGSKTLQS